MTPQDLYVVQCEQDNFEDAKCLLQMFCRIVSVDERNHRLTTYALEGMLKQRLVDLGASFWQEHFYEAEKRAAA